MTGLRIAEVARRTGIPASTVRYYEEIGLVAPAARAVNGYREYGDRDVERLRFVARARRLELGLDDLRELLTAWDGDDCADVQARLAAVVAERLTQTRRRIADLMELSTQLEAAAERLDVEPRPGRCDADCACTASAADPSPRPTAVHLVRRSAR